MRELSGGVVIVGGGLGGVAAALAALRAGRTVIMTEETDWIGGQLTAQAVPPDEHPWIEQFGCTRAYRRFRDDVREYYRRWYPLTPEARADKAFNPGGGWVSRLCHEPRIALAVMQAQLQPYLASGRLTLLLEQRPVAAATDRDRIRSITIVDLRTGDRTELAGKYFIDATELGDVLPLAKVEHVTGAESQDQTGEPHAKSGAPQPLNQVCVTHCFAMSHHPGENHVIDRPEAYGFWTEYRAPFMPHGNLSWKQTHPKADFWPDLDLAWRDGHATMSERVLFTEDVGGRHYEGLWGFRQIVDKARFLPGAVEASVTLVNWPQIDYWLGPLAGVSPEEEKRHRKGARDLSLCFLYWMQTDAPRPDGGTGYPGLKLRGDIVGTRDGLAKAVYVRESRRIRAEFTICEQHIVAAHVPTGPARFDDSVGVGCQRTDLHPSTGGDDFLDWGSWPFEIPLGSMIPQRVENLLPAAKNIGSTHITNGSYRMHPIEWNIGEAAGALAAHCLQTGHTPRAVRNDKTRLRDFQKLLRNQGFELEWPAIHVV
jgi:hypothetical protein